MRRFWAILAFILFLFGCATPAVVQLAEVESKEDPFDAPVEIAESNVEKAKRRLVAKYPKAVPEIWFSHADDE